MNLIELVSIKDALYFSGLIAICVYVYRMDQRRKFFAGDTIKWHASENMPMDLCAASIHMSEKEISCSSPTRLHGRVDQVYINNNLLIPVDTKTRSRHEVTKEDQIQLSSYGFILRHSQDIPVAPYGYIRSVIVTPKGDMVKYIKVDLLCDEAVISIAQQHQRSKGGGNTQHSPAGPKTGRAAQSLTTLTPRRELVAKPAALKPTPIEARVVRGTRPAGMPKGYIPFDKL